MSINNADSARLTDIQSDPATVPVEVVIESSFKEVDVLPQFVISIAIGDNFDEFA